MRKFFLSFILCMFVLAGLQAQTLKRSVTWENICAHPAPLPIVGSLDHHASSLDRPSLWSIGSETLDRDFAVFDKYIQYMGETGVGYSRLQSGWAKTEPRKGKYEFAWLDHQVDGLLEQGIHPWLCLCYGNPIYSDSGHDLNARIFADGPVMDAWLKYVRQTVRRYKGKVTMYEVWNEPDGAKPANGVKGESWREYSNLFVRTAKVIREEDPDAKIAALAAYSFSNGYFANALNEIKRLGGLEYIDYVTYHAYWSVPERIIKRVKELQRLCAELNPSIKVLQGETGCPAQLEYGHALNNIEWSEYSQAKYDMRHMLINFSLGCHSSVFTMVDLNYGWMQQSYGLIRTNLKGEPQYKRPKFHAVRNVTSVFTPDLEADPEVRLSNSNCDLPMQVVGIRKVSCALVSPSSADTASRAAASPDCASAATACESASPACASAATACAGKTVGVMLWLCGDRPTSSLERRLLDISLTGITFEDPVYVDMLTGLVHEIKDRCRNKPAPVGVVPDGAPILAEASGVSIARGACDIRKIPVWDSPILVIERSAIRLAAE